MTGAIRGKERLAAAFVVGYEGIQWLGGVIYFRNLFNALALLPEQPLGPVLLAGTGPEPEAFQLLRATAILRTALFDRGSAAWWLRQLLMKLGPGDLLTERLLLRNGVDVLSHRPPLRRRARLAVVSWIPDFQHLHLPRFFSERERFKLNRLFSYICRYAQRIIVSSRDARADLERFDPSAAGRARVLHFVADTAGGEKVAGLAGLRDKYGIPARFYHLPNQLWAHKNHPVVLEALHLLKPRGLRPYVVLTGDTEDARNPRYFPELRERIAALGLNDQVKVLGRVPFADVLGLMSHAVAVINPSLFEGWSTTVEEAKSLGKRTILSNLPVHREQDPEGALFFDPGNPGDLAERLGQAWAWPEGHDAELRARAAAGLRARKEAFALEYLQIVHEALACQNYA